MLAINLIVSNNLYAGSQVEESVVKGRTLFDFATEFSAQQWVNVNDGVMGGASAGKRRIRDNRLEFKGNLSLANNGGFASVRSRPNRLGLRDSDVLVIRVRGDGRQYYMNLRTPNNRIAFSYRSSFATKPGEWLELQMPVKVFQATSFGRKLGDVGPVAANSVNSLGFMIADKKAGPFKLQVDWIKVLGEQKQGSSQLSESPGLVCAHHCPRKCVMLFKPRSVRHGSLDQVYRPTLRFHPLGPPGRVPLLRRYYQSAMTSCRPSRRASFPSLGGTSVVLAMFASRRTSTT